MGPFAIAIFLGAFLLFLIQPLTGRFVLPWFGGSPGIWTVCLLFFQSALFLGYGYAHLLGRIWTPRRQITFHLGLLAGALLWLPPIPDAPSAQVAAARPTGELLLLLARHVGVVFVLLSATGPLVQRWFHTAMPERSPYRLYALSNLGSLVALIAYPFVLEPLFSRSQQAWGWSVGFVGFLIVCAWCSRNISQDSGSASSRHIPSSTETVTWRQRFKWICFAALGTGLLASVTAVISADVAPVPFLWIAPITIYLLSFIVTFSGRSWYRPVAFAGALMVVAAATMDLRAYGSQLEFGQLLGTCLLALAIGCIVCHGELYRSRPAPAQLTDYYLTIAGGGALGTLWVAVISPTIFNTTIDLPLIWATLIGLVAWRTLRQRNLATAWAIWLGQLSALVMIPILRPTAAFSRFENLQGVVSHDPMQLIILLVGSIYLGYHYLQKARGAWKHAFTIATIGLPLLTGGYYLRSALQLPTNTVASYRSFHGQLIVRDHKHEDSRANARFMSHGSTTHGIQLLHPAYRDYPTSYYVPASGVGRAFTRTNQTPGRNIGIVGLGVGTVASYGMTGDHMRFFEIDPHVVEIARTHFDYLARSKARIETVLGDGRLMLERENTTAAPRYDILILDAFSGDAVPIHLLTQEAFAIYLERLAPDGILAINVSNRIIDLRRAIHGNARQANLSLAHIIHYPEEKEWWRFSSEWLLLAPRHETLDTPTITEWTGIVPPSTLEGPVWTDEFASIFSMLR